MREFQENEVMKIGDEAVVYIGDTPFDDVGVVQAQYVSRALYCDHLLAKHRPETERKYIRGADHAELIPLGFKICHMCDGSGERFGGRMCDECDGDGILKL